MGSWCTSLESVVDSGRGYEESMLILKKAGFESIEDLPRTAVGFRSKTYLTLSRLLGARSENSRPGEATIGSNLVEIARSRYYGSPKLSNLDCVQYSGGGAPEKRTYYTVSIHFLNIFRANRASSKATRLFLMES